MIKQICFYLLVSLILFSASIHAQTVGPFTWARKLLADSTAPIGVDISARGDIENASLINGDPNTGQIELFQWQGDNQAGSRSWAGNTLVGSASENYYIRLDEFQITGAVTQQDAHLRLGYVNQFAASLNIDHGTNFGLDGVLPYDAVILALAFRNVAGGSTSWQTGYYKGNPVQAALWAVPQGKTVGQAQQSTLNRLAQIDLLKEIPPGDGLLSFKLQVQPDGHWKILIDLGLDGEVDQSYESGVGQNLIHPFIGLGQQSGLLVTSGAAGGNKSGTVGTTRLKLSFRSDALSDAGSYERRPLSVTIPEQSVVSPITLRGERWNGTFMVTAESPSLPAGPQPITYLGSRDFFIDLPLSPTSAVDVTFEQSGSPPSVRTGSVLWSPTDLRDKVFSSDHIQIRKQDRLLLTTSGPGTALQIDFDGDGVVDFTGVPGDSFPAQYNIAGTFKALAYIDGVEVGSLAVDVVEVVFLPQRPACEVGFTRLIDVNTGAHPASEIAFMPGDPQDLQVTVVETSGNLARLNVKPLRRGTPVIKALRNGNFVACREIDEFTFKSTAAKSVVFFATQSEDMGVGTATLTISPHIPNLSVTLTKMNGGATFTGSRASIKVSTNDFTILPNGDGQYKYDQEVDTFPNAPIGQCHNIEFSQVTNPEFKVSKKGAQNGCSLLVKYQKCVCKLPDGSVNTWLEIQESGNSQSQYEVGLAIGEEVCDTACHTHSDKCDSEYFQLRNLRCSKEDIKDKNMFVFGRFLNDSMTCRKLEVIDVDPNNLERRLIGAPDSTCPPINPNLFKFTDCCENEIIESCEGAALGITVTAFRYKLNGRLVGFCPFEGGLNNPEMFYVPKPDDDEKALYIVRTVHTSEDRGKEDGPPWGCVDGKRDKWTFKFDNCTGVFTQSLSKDGAVVATSTNRTSVKMPNEIGIDACNP